jgi:hypothetical protein
VHRPGRAVTFTDQPCSGAAVSVETLSADPNANSIDSRPARDLLDRERARDEARARARSLSVSGGLNAYQQCPLFFDDSVIATI